MPAYRYLTIVTDKSSTTKASFLKTYQTWCVDDARV